jgi:hypothetical protein
MRVTVNDSRLLAVCVIQPAADKFYNWITQGWDQTFKAAAHLQPLTPLEKSPSLFATVLSVDLGTIMLDRTDVAAIVMTVDSTGAPLAAIDVWTLPFPTPSPVAGGWSQQ